MAGERIESQRRAGRREVTAAAAASAAGCRRWWQRRAAQLASGDWLLAVMLPPRAGQGCQLVAYAPTTRRSWPAPRVNPHWRLRSPQRRLALFSGWTCSPRRSFRASGCAMAGRAGSGWRAGLGAVTQAMPFRAGFDDTAGNAEVQSRGARSSQRGSLDAVPASLALMPHFLSLPDLVRPAITTL